MCCRINGNEFLLTDVLLVREKQEKKTRNEITDKSETTFARKSMRKTLKVLDLTNRLNVSIVND